MNPVRNKALLSMIEPNPPCKLSNGIPKNQIKVLDREVEKLIENPRIGKQKKGGELVVLCPWAWGSTRSTLCLIHLL